ncbi:MAG: protein translocase subunit SecF [Patescibacteria group bacterium]|jgi:preprotein translocase subunit SecF
MKLQIIKNRKYYYLASGVLFVASVLAIIAWGLKPGLDFTGGSLLELSFADNRPQNAEIQEATNHLDLGEVIIQPSGDKNVILKFQNVNEDQHQQVLQSIDEKFPGQTQELRFESIGPVIGQELQKKAWMAIAVASLCIILYIAFAFRKVSKPVESWKYGITAILALIHDITIVVGLFAVLGHFVGIEVDGLFITALLTIMGFSVHDTIVVFDRTRENLGRFYTGKFDEVVNDSINQTVTRSINTSLTVLLVLFCLYLFGGASTKNFTLALLVGILIGTYSSIFIASCLLVDWNIWDKKLKK